MPEKSTPPQRSCHLRVRSLHMLGRNNLANSDLIEPVASSCGFVWAHRSCAGSKIIVLPPTVGDNPAMDTFKYSASRALAEMKSGKLTPEAYAASCLERIALRDRDVHAWACIDPDLVL